MHQIKTNPSCFLKKVKLNKSKLPPFKDGGLNDVIEDFFSKTEEKISLKIVKINLMSV